MAPALAGRPETPQVVALLTAYYAAINRKDFASAMRTLVDRPGLPRTEAEFRRRFRSTSNSGVRLLGLRAEGDGYLISVSFTSHQDPVDAPDGASPCVRWSVQYPLVRVDGTLRIDEVRKSNLVYRRC